MNLFVWNLILALAWATATGDFSVSNALLGFAISFFSLFAVRRALPETRYFGRFRSVIRFLGFFLWEMLLANLRVAYDVVTPRHRMRPGVIAVPLDARTDVEIALLANLITLTPGTLSLDVSDDRRVLYLHVMYIDHDDVEAVRGQIKEGIERRLLGVLR
jgi:multicomponent Na+:H+ antiporter subunit E